MRDEQNFTRGKIYGPLMRFTLPILFATALQAMYGAVDLAVVGWFGTAPQVSAVSTGSQIMQTITTCINSLSMGTTILLGQKIGEGRRDEGGRVVGGSVCLFALVALSVTALLQLAAVPAAKLLQAPEEAFAGTVSYVRICAGGSLFMVAYNLLGSIFRGLGDSKTPLLSVGIACGFNILGDLFFVGVLGMAQNGAALATVMAQGLSVVICLLVVRKRGLPFDFALKDVGFHGKIIRRTLQLGIPVATQEMLVNVSFLVILSIINGLGLLASAGAGVTEKLCLFIMLVPASFMKALSAFVAQNAGAGEHERARRSLLYSIITSFCFGAVMFWLSWFHGDLLTGIFAHGDERVVATAVDYLRAYALDTVLVPFLFCFVGYFNGYGRTLFVMAEGLSGAFGVRIPVAFLMSRLGNVSLFRVGLATPCSTLVQILLCLIYYRVLTLRLDRREAAAL